MTIAGDEQHPANFGRLCVKGSALGETIGLDGRLLHPKMRERASGALRDVSWDEAIDAVADGFRRIVDEHGPDAVALYVSGPVADRGLLRREQADERLRRQREHRYEFAALHVVCRCGTQAGLSAKTSVPVCYDDLELADLVVLVGSNTAWCHPILFQRIVEDQEARPRHESGRDRSALYRDVRDGRPASAGAPGTRRAGFSTGCSGFSRSTVSIDRAVRRCAYQRSCAGTSRCFDGEVTSTTAAFDRAQCAKACQVDPQRSARVLSTCSRAPSASSTVFSQGVNQSSAGTDKVNSIINCHLLTGRIGKPGMGPFSITGQPNAMGGREVGGLANTLAAHLELDDAEHRELRAEILGQRRLSHRARGSRPSSCSRRSRKDASRPCGSWRTNPVVSLPDADQVEARARALRTGGRAPTLSSAPTPMRSRACCCRRSGLGARRMAPSRIRSAGFRVSARSCSAAGRGARGLANHLRCGKAHGLMRASNSRASRRSSTSMRG